jgi:hypothetical protein
MASVETDDGVAIIGYSGLGATSLGNEPSEWIGNVLRGRRYSLEQCLGTLAGAIKAQFPPHLARMHHPFHTMVVPAFLGDDARIYTIDLLLAPNRSDYAFRYAHHIRPDTGKAPRLTAAGSGSVYLTTSDGAWMRELLRLVNAHDRRRIGPLVVADWLARLSYRVHMGTRDGSVGPRCIVAWRYRQHSANGGGGGSQYYTRESRDSASPALPTIANGQDVRAIARVFMPYWMENISRMASGNAPLPFDDDAINADLGQLPTDPDERLS